jgi:hypothetical protein
MMKASWIAALVFAVHVVLLFLPPIPPFYKGSLWSFALAYGTVALGMWNVRRWGPPLAAWWSALGPRARAARVLASVGIVGAFGGTLRAAAPQVFARFSREEGVWEPLTLLAFLASASLLLLVAARAAEDGAQRHLRLLGAGFVLLALEEVDYFGLFGGLMGRIEGTYAGALHDVIRLWSKGLLTRPAIAVGVASVAIGSWVLHRSGYLQPHTLVAMIRSWQGIWLAAGFGLLSASAVQETARVRPFASPSPEELFELLGAICLVAFAFEACAAARTRAPAPAPAALHSRPAV